MNTMNPRFDLVGNLARLGGDTYFGRMFIIGLSPDGKHYFIIYIVTGGSPPSRNRRQLRDPMTGRVWTEIADPNLLDGTEKLDLILYDSMLEERAGGFFYVSNGNQTKTALDASSPNLTIALAQRKHEPDKGNWTRRITGLLHTCSSEGDPLVQIHTIDPSACCEPAEDGPTDPSWYGFGTLSPGIGWGMATYEGNRAPIVRFGERPIQFPVYNTMDENLNAYENAANTPHFVSVAVKMISVQTGKRVDVDVRNRYEAVPLREKVAVPV